LSDVHLLAREFHSLVCGCHDSRASQYHHFAGLCLVLHRRRRCCFCFFFFIAFLLLFCIFFVLLLLYCVGFKFSLPALVLFYFTVETFFLDPFQPPSMYAQLLCLLLGLLLKPFASVFMAASVHLIDSVDDLFDSFPTYVTIFNWCVKIVKLAKRSFIIFHSFVFLLLLFSFFFIVLTI
jgi:hypothetical protein